MSLSRIWPAANAIDSISADGSDVAGGFGSGDPSLALGDCWRHSAVRGPGLTNGWMPFHKLSQWLTYSLLEPFEWAGVKVRHLEALTALPEYRNGGLLLDSGVIVPKDPALLERTWKRATSSSSNGARSPSRCSTSSRRGCARCSTAARTSCRWPACSKAAPGPPAGRWHSACVTVRHPCASRATARSSRLLTFPQYNAHEQRPPVDHPLVQHKLTLMRRKEASTNSFRRLLNEISMLMAYEVTRDMPMQDIEIETPLETMNAKVIDGKKLVLVSILRAGTGILDGMLSVVPGARVGHIGLYRDPKTLTAVEYYFKMPGGHGRARLHRGRPDAGHRQLGRRRGGAAEGAEPEVDQVRLPAHLPRRHQDASRPRTPTCRSTPRPSTASSTATATSCRAWAMPATGSSAPSNFTATRRSPCPHAVI